MFPVSRNHIGSKTLPVDYEKIIKKNSNKILEDAKFCVRDTTLEVDALVLKGKHISETIINYLNKENIDLAVMGSLGVGSAKGLLIGSVCCKVLRYVDTPVLVVR